MNQPCFSTGSYLGSQEITGRYVETTVRQEPPDYKPVVVEELPKDPLEVFAVTSCEGGTWVPWSEWGKLNTPGPKGKRVHAIWFQDGSIWDAVNGRRSVIGSMTKEDVMRIWGEFFRAKEILLSEMRDQPEVFGEI